MPLFLFGVLSWLTFFTELRAKEISPNQEDHSKKYLNEVNKYYYSYRNAIKNDSFLSVWHDGKVIYGVESGGSFDFTRFSGHGAGQQVPMRSLRARFFKKHLGDSKPLK